MGILSLPSPRSQQQSFPRLRPQLRDPLPSSKNGDARSVSGPTALWITFELNEMLFPSCPCTILWLVPWPPREGRPLFSCPSCQRVIDSHTFQLARWLPWPLSTYLVIKVHAESYGHDSQRKKLKLSSMLVDLSRGLFSAKDICEMECNMLSTLSWRQVNPITPSSLAASLLHWSL